LNIAWLFGLRGWIVTGSAGSNGDVYLSGGAGVAKKRSKRHPAAKRRGQVPPAVDRQPKLEALSVVLAKAPGRDPATLARTLTRRIGLDGWKIEAVVDDYTEVEILPPPRGVSVARAWDLTYALRDQPEVTYASPMFRYFVPENGPAPVRARRASGRGAGDDPATDTDYEWSLVKSNVLEAWRLFGARLPGAGV
jgi:hypothetical protein